MTFNEDDTDFPLTYSIDNAILMHRDAHFGGDFDIMIKYYEKGGKGISSDFDLQRIKELAEIEKQSQKNLAPFLLSGAEAEKVARAKQAYQQLRELYEIPNPKSQLPLLVADLILSEDVQASKEIEALAAQKGAAVPFLIDLLRNEEFHDPLFPGYGLAPGLAAQCLGAIGDKRAIISLFESIGEGDFFDEDVILDSLKIIGAPAKEFLLKVLHGRPLNQDNEKAAIALIEFKEDPQVAAACLKMLQEIDMAKQLPLTTYLILTCEGLRTEVERRALIALSESPGVPQSVRQDIQTIATLWRK
jgi:hypothetical protein